MRTRSGVDGGQQRGKARRDRTGRRAAPWYGGDWPAAAQAQLAAAQRLDTLAEELAVARFALRQIADRVVAGNDAASLWIKEAGVFCDLLKVVVQVYDRHAKQRDSVAFASHAAAMMATFQDLGSESGDDRPTEEA